MEASDHFRLKWDNFQKSMFAALENLHLSEDFVDVTLYCEGVSIKAHKVILSACSPYFRSVFKDNPCRHPVVIIKGVSSDDIAALLSFMYQGEVCVPHERLTDLLHAAELLKVRGLTAAFSNDYKTDSSANDNDHQVEANVDTIIQKESLDDSELISKKHLLSDDSNSDDTSIVKAKKIRLHRISQSQQSDENDNCEITENSDASGALITEERLAKSPHEMLPEKNIDRSQNNNVSFYNCDNSDTVRQDSNQNNQERLQQKSNDNIVIKKEIVDSEVENEETEEQENNRESEQLPSILQRSLIGDHTVKPAESLIITPDLPLESPTIVKCEANDPLCHSEPPPLVPIRFYSKSDSKHQQTSLGMSSQSTLSQQEVKTLEILKNNPNISVSAEKISDESSVTYSKGSSAKQKVRSVKQIEPEISIKPVKQIRTSTSSSGRMQKFGTNHKSDSEQRITSYNLSESSTNVKMSILAQNLIQGSQKQQQSSTTQTKSGLTPSSTTTTQSQQNLPQVLYQSTSASVPSNQGQIWNCPHCTQVYNNQSALKYHVRLVHSDFTNRLCCFLCPTSFTMRESYKIHMFETHGIRN